MPEHLSNDLLLKLMRATPEQLAAVERILATAPAPGEAHASEGRSFRRCGDFWKVRFDGHELYLAQSLGACYLDNLLHRPNQPIPAFDLERAITPERAAVRAINSSDGGGAVRGWLRELERLREERDEAAAHGDFGRAERIEADLAALEAQLKQTQRVHDTGERARNNVRKAIGAVVRGLQRGDAAQKTFAAHLGQFLATGYECVYHQSPGGEWG